MRGATHGDDSDAAFELFQSTHPVRGATGDFDVVFQDDTISIHAPREGCDANTARYLFDPIFQSTHPVRGATINIEDCGRLSVHFNPRTP